MACPNYYTTMAYRNIAENFGRLSRAHERYRRHRQMEFTFAKTAIDCSSDCKSVIISSTYITTLLTRYIAKIVYVVNSFPCNQQYPTSHELLAVHTESGAARLFANVRRYRIGCFSQIGFVVIHILYNRTWFISQFCSVLSSSPRWPSG